MWLTQQVESRMDGKPRAMRKKIIRNNRRNFERIFEAIDLSQEDLNKPMNQSNNDALLGLSNPYSKATCLILYLYSMEIGTPQLYAEANRVARDMDRTKLKELGAFLQALFEITNSSEKNKKKQDKIMTGWEHRGECLNIGGSFMLFRGAPMKDEWVQPYVDRVGGEVGLPGNNSCSKSPVVALGFALNEPKKDMKPTLFVISCQNYRKISGITMNNEAYSAYPSEAEVLLCEGCAVFVLTVDFGFKVDACQVGHMSPYHGKEVTIVNLFHYDW